MKIKKFKQENNEKVVLNSSEIYYEGGETLDNLINLIYPVGSIYMSTNSVSPQTFLGGTWNRIQDRFLLCAGSTYTAGDTGGSATHKLTIAEMPSHRHRQGASASKPAGGQSWDCNQVIGQTEPDDNGMYSYYEGGSQAHNNMPPYLVVYCWNRTA